MPTIVQTVSGRVTGLWGHALIRGADGKMHALKLGDIVHRGDVILTTQDGIVQLTPEDTSTSAKATPAADDIDRVIAGINTDDPTAATAAIGTADGAGDLSPGLRVDRVSEAVTPGGGLLTTGAAPAATTFVNGNQITAPENQNPVTTPVTPAPGIDNSANAILGPTPDTLIKLRNSRRSLSLPNA